MLYLWCEVKDMKQKKTNAMRILENEGIKYDVRTFKMGKEHIEGQEVAELIGASPEQVFKTLLFINNNHDPYVFVIPVEGNLNMKHAAQAVGEKKLHLLPLQELTKVTGYIRGGCSPVGMKHLYPTVIDASAEQQETIFVSAGHRGVQMEVNVEELAKVTNAKIADVANHHTN